MSTLGETSLKSSRAELIRKILLTVDQHPSSIYDILYSMTNFSDPKRTRLPKLLKAMENENLVISALQALLDEVSEDHPIMVARVCGHLASVNSIGLKITGQRLDSEEISTLVGVRGFESHPRHH